MRTEIDPRVNGHRARPDEDGVAVRVPALRRYVSAVRSLATVLAAQCDLTLDEIEDVQLAVDEVCALLLPHADRSRPWLEMNFQLVEGRFAVSADVATVGPVELDRSNLSWTVLEAVGDGVSVSADGRSLAITFVKLRGAVQS